MSDLLSSLWEFLKGLWKHLDKVSILLGGIASLGGYYFYHWTTELANPASLEKLRPYLENSPWRDTYRRTLYRALDAADRFFGPPISLRAYGACLVIAFFYPIVLFLLTWVLGGSRTLGGLVILPEGWPTAMRVTLIAGLVLHMCAIFVLLEYSDEVDAWTDHILAWMMPGWGAEWRRGVLATVTGLLAGIAGYVIIIPGDVTFAVGGAVVVGGAVAVGGAIGVALTVAVAVPPALAVTGVGAYAFALSGAVVGGVVGGVVASRAAGVGPIFGTGARARALAFYAFAFVFTFFFIPGALAFTGYLWKGWIGVFHPAVMSGFVFFFVLPLLNAALDTASWAVSRRLGRKMLDRNFHRGRMIGFATLDAILAFVLLWALALLLGIGGEAVDQLAVATTGNSALDLDMMVAQATTEPFGDGLWITLMLFSTIVPTAIHAFVAIGSVVQMRGRAEARKKWRDVADEALAKDKGLDPHTCRKIAEHWLIDRWLPSIVLLLVLLAAGWFAWHASVLPGALLAAVEWGRSLVG